MTAPLAASPANSAITPGRVLSVVAVLLILFMILAPQPRTDDSAIFSTYGAGPNGSRALYDALTRLGFRTHRTDGPITAGPDSGSVYVLLHATQPLTASDRAKLVDAVSHGAVLVFTADDEALADSLDFKRTMTAGYYTLDNTTVAGGNPSEPETNDGTRFMFPTPIPVNQVVGTTSRTGGEPFLWIDPRARSPRVIRNTADSTGLATVVLGHAVGHGYAIAIAATDMMVNQAMRDPRPIIAVVRAIRFGCSRVGSGPDCSSIVFDEYHHGYGQHANIVAAIDHALVDTAPGRMMIELIAAALVLLLAYSVRPLAPVARPVVSRRSPLEHVGALAHAYAQIDSRRLGVRRLTRGLRRRHSLGIPVSVPDQVYLSALRSRLPSVESSVDRVAAALSADSHNSPDRFATTGEAFANIERAFPK